MSNEPWDLNLIWDWPATCVQFPSHVSIVGFLVASEFIGECKNKFRCVAKYPQLSSFVAKLL
jgi:hypothetical protein